MSPEELEERDEGGETAMDVEVGSSWIVKLLFCTMSTGSGLVLSESVEMVASAESEVVAGLLVPSTWRSVFALEALSSLLADDFWMLLLELSFVESRLSETLGSTCISESGSTSMSMPLSAIDLVVVVAREPPCGERDS